MGPGVSREVEKVVRYLLIELKVSYKSPLYHFISFNWLLSMFRIKIMFVVQLSVNFLIFTIGLIGIIVHRRSVLFILICLELVLLSLSLSFVLFSIYFDDVYGQIFSFFILTVAAAESAVGLAIIIAYYRVRGSISINQISTIRR